MKKFLLLLPIITLVAAACNQRYAASPDSGREGQNLPQGSKAGWSTFANAKYGYEFQYPKDWELRQAGGPVKEAAVYLASAKRGEGDTRPASVDVMVYENTPDLAGHVNRKILPGFTNGTTSDFAFAGAEGQKVMAPSDPSYYLIVLARGGYLYQLTVREKQLYGQSQKQADDFSGTIKQVLSTFKFVDPAPQAGPMPKMSYELTDSSCRQGGEYSHITLSADNKRVAVLKAPLCEISKVVFRAGNSQVVYFSVVPGGLGGYYSYVPVFNLYRLDLEKKVVDSIDTGKNWVGGLDFSNDLTKAIYVPYENPKQGVVALDLTTGARETFKPVPAAGKQRVQMGNIKFSPDMTKAAIAAAYGPDKEYGEIYILDLVAKKYTLYKSIDSGHLQVNGWRNNSEVDWSKI